jgi:hypothetical protein
LLPSAVTRTLEGAGQRFSQRTSYRTDEVEIISDGHVQGSAVEARVRLIVVRSDQGALVVTRVFD